MSDFVQALGHRQNVARVRGLAVRSSVGFTAA
jgi:hypothetical protein